MQIAIDGAFLELPPSGTGAYLRNLLAAMEAVAPDLRISLLRPRWGQRGNERTPWARITNDRRVRRAAWDAGGVARAARATRPDVLHIPSFSAPVAPPCPVVVTVHDVIPLVLPEYRASPAMRLHLAMMRRTVPRSAAVLAPSHHAAATIGMELGIPRSRIHVTYEAADPSCVPAPDLAAAKEAVRRFGIGGRYVYNVGGLDARKNLSVLLEAFALLRARLDEPLQLVIAGAAHSANTVVFPPLEPVVRRLGLEGAVLLPGRVSEAEKLALYQAAELYVTPSRYEGFGLTALEAMACGVPTIVADRTSLPEVVGAGALVVEPDPEALAATMQLVLASPAAAGDLRARGLTRAAEFGWERTARQTLAVYREVVERSGRSRRSVFHPITRLARG